MPPEGTVVAGVAGADRAALSAPDGVSLADPEDDCDLLVAVGEPAVLAGLDGPAPILPVEAGTGLRSVPRERLTEALASVAAGERTVGTVPTVDVRIGGDHAARALLDVMLVTEAPAHISEFSVETPTDAVARFRADGVLVATAAGTGGYARQVGSPVLAPELQAAAVVPIAPFATRLDHWVVPMEAGDPVVETVVEREEAAVSLLADDRTVGTVPPHTPITVAVDESVAFLRVPESESCFRRSRRSDER